MAYRKERYFHESCDRSFVNNLLETTRSDGPSSHSLCAFSGVNAEPETTSGEKQNSAEADTMEATETKVVNEQELKYWKAVQENPSDFTSWTYLLQFVEQEVSEDPFSGFLSRVFTFATCVEFVGVSKLTLLRFYPGES